MNIVGIDIGASNLRIVLSDRSGRLREVSSEKTNAAELMEQIFAGLRRLSGFDAIGIAAVGPLDVKEGVILNPPNVRVRNLEIVRLVRTRFKRPCYLVNDCVAAVLGEKMFGAGRGVPNLVYVTLSTGVGCGVIVDGRVLQGKDGNAHEIGHCTVDVSGALRCGCGSYGHWEAYCGGAHIPAFARLLLRTEYRHAASALRGARRTLSPEALFRAARSDRVAAQIVERIGMFNGVGVANAINAYDPELVTIGGPIALRHAREVMTPIRRHARRYAINRVPRIVLTPLKDLVVVYGAVASVLSRHA
ncbi:MAG TPA: ROK family protein [bacterium]|nr:ROK family protein [bacterium]